MNWFRSVVSLANVVPVGRLVFAVTRLFSNDCNAE